MKEQVRRAIAHSAAAQINGRSGGTVYSYDQGNHAQMSGSPDGSGYDYDAGAHITTAAGGLYHHGVGSHIQLTIRGNNFDGYDFDEGHHFKGEVRGTGVQIYDYGEGRYFNYQV